jgi:GNAT superfamily N-acetyltransferase
MNFIHNVEILSGAGICAAGVEGDIAQLVSDWLAASAPDTKPKSVEQILEHIDQSIFAIHPGNVTGHELLLGHVALHEQTPLEVEAASGVAFPLSHTSIESLVVNPLFHGKGVGKMLLKSALSHIASGADKTNGMALASGVACDASASVFKSQGFHFPGSPLSSLLEDVEPYVGGGLFEGKMLVGRLEFIGSMAHARQSPRHSTGRA